MTTKLGLQLHSALLATGLVQPIDVKDGKNGLSFLCRAVPGQESMWLKAAEALLKTVSPDILFIGSKFVIKDDHMVKGVYLALSCKPALLKETVEVIVNILISFKALLNPVMPQRMTPPTVNAGPKDDIYKDPAVLAAKVAAHTRATPREMEGSGPDPVPPPGMPAPSVRVVRNELTNDGERIIEQEMPLPHVYKEMGTPNELGRGSYLPKQFTKKFSELHRRKGND